MVPVWVLDAGLTGAELAVHISLRSFADRRGEAHPLVRTIAQRAGVSVRTAERAIARMREIGMLTSEQIIRPDGSVGGCRYRLVDIPPIGTDRDPSPPPDRDVANPRQDSDPVGTPRRARRTPPDEPVGTPPTGLSEQEHTKEHTKELPVPRSPHQRDGDGPDGDTIPSPGATRAQRGQAPTIATLRAWAPHIDHSTLLTEAGAWTTRNRGRWHTVRDPQAAWLAWLERRTTRTPTPSRPRCPLHPQHPTGTRQCPECASVSAPPPDNLRLLVARHRRQAS